MKEMEIDYKVMDDKEMKFEIIIEFEEEYDFKCLELLIEEEDEELDLVEEVRVEIIVFLSEFVLVLWFF